MIPTRGAYSARRARRHDSRLPYAGTTVGSDRTRLTNESGDVQALCARTRIEVIVDLSLSRPDALRGAALNVPEGCEASRPHPPIVYLHQWRWVR